MIQALAILITIVSTVGLGILIEEATGVWRILKAWVRARPRSGALPHAKDGLDEKETE